MSIIPMEAMSRWPWIGWRFGSADILSLVLCAERVRPVPRMNVEAPYSVSMLSIATESPECPVAATAVSVVVILVVVEGSEADVRVA